MATNEPMTDDMLTDDEREIITEEYVRSVQRELAEALVEIARLRAREQALAAENEQKQAQIDAMRPMVEAVAEAGVGDEYDGGSWLMFAGYDAETIREQARAFVAAHPTSTAADEAESEGEGGVGWQSHD